MWALSASRLVCSAMVLMSSTTAPMRLAAFDNSLTRSLVARACPTASVAIRADSCTCRLISLTEEAISSVAEATDCTLVEASSEAAATMVVSSWARSGGVVGSRRPQGREFLGPFGGRGQRTGGGFEFGGCRRHGLDDLADRA